MREHLALLYDPLIDPARGDVAKSTGPKRGTKWMRV
jgi:hypothetical protein